MSRQTSQMLQWAAIAICGVAGVWTLFHIVWNMQEQTGDDYWGQALFVLFVLSLILAFTLYFQNRSALTKSTSQEEFPEPAIATFFFGSSGAAALWFVVRMNVGAQWLLAGWEKAKDPTWGANGTALKGFITAAIAKSGG
ncbi:MAG: hypothetical protein ACXWQR_02890, partial [Ktedonobacterales bacterium]